MLSGPILAIRADATREGGAGHVMRLPRNGFPEEAGAFTSVTIYPRCSRIDLNTEDVRLKCF